MVADKASGLVEGCAYIAGTDACCRRAAAVCIVVLPGVVAVAVGIRVVDILGLAHKKQKSESSVIFGGDSRCADNGLWHRFLEGPLVQNDTETAAGNKKEPNKIVQ